jgi:peptidoglycan hydrolase-like protein with peptidoglycan-binding domain
LAPIVFRGDVSPSQIQRRRRPLLALLTVLAALGALAQLPAPAAAETGGAGGEVEEAPVLGSTPFDRQGMWIWYVSKSEGGSIPAIVARAKASDIGTVYVKSGDGGTVWSQFNKSLVTALHRGGLDVCAWQFVYGDHPAAEARVGAISAARGADCLVIDAEGEYEGKYASADRYIRSLRAAVGEAFPVSLAGFPYVDYHPSFPYSVFFGPGGATFNQPQMYWKAIGTSVRAVYEHTYLYNRIWGHPIYPIGQTYEGPGNGPLKLFRRFAASYGGLPPSWWDWQETTGKEWAALGASSALRPVTGYRQVVTHPLLKRGSKGDMVVWAQEHLVAAGQEVPITGIFGKQTRAAVRAFQEGHGLTVDGAIGTTTWQALMTFTPYRMRWAARRARPGATSSRVAPARRPLSASLPAKGYEIPPSSGQLPGSVAGGAG